MAHKGLPQTFKGGTVTLTPITLAGVPAVDPDPILIVNAGGTSADDSATSESSTNTEGVLIAFGNSKTKIDLTGIVSKDTVPSPFTAPDAFGLRDGDFVTAEIKAGSFEREGIFGISSLRTSLDSEERMHLEMSLVSHGHLTTKTNKVITATA
jgi:hypothetical protein